MTSLTCCLPEYSYDPLVCESCTNGPFLKEAKACQGRGACGCKTETTPLGVWIEPDDPYKEKRKEIFSTSGATSVPPVLMRPAPADDEVMARWFQDQANRHPNSSRFHDLLKQAGELHDVKQSDYGQGDDPFANVRASEEWGIEGWKGAMIRLNDKVRRLQSLAVKGHLNNEAVYDSFLDIAVYSLIAYVLYEQEHGV